MNSFCGIDGVVVTLRCASLRTGGERAFLGLRVLVHACGELSAFRLLLEPALPFQRVVGSNCGVLRVVGEWIFESGDASLFYDSHISLQFEH